MSRVLRRKPRGPPMTEASGNLSVVIPVYKEVKTIGEVIKGVLDCGFDPEVIVVDDASSDLEKGVASRARTGRTRLPLARRPPYLRVTPV
ncbi:MAG: glycosyltransferase [Terriglobia bacterium]